MNTHSTPPFASTALLSRRQIIVPIFDMDSSEDGMGLLDFEEHITEAMQDLTEHEKKTARLALTTRRKIEGAFIDDVACLSISILRDESDADLAERQTVADANATLADSLRAARDRVEFARLTRLFAPTA